MIVAESCYSVSIIDAVRSICTQVADSTASVRPVDAGVSL